MLWVRAPHAQKSGRAPGSGSTWVRLGKARECLDPRWRACGVWDSERVVGFVRVIHLRSNKNPHYQRERPCCKQAQRQEPERQHLVPASRLHFRVSWRTGCGVRCVCSVCGVTRNETPARVQPQPG